MTTIGGKHRAPHRPSQPQFVVRWSDRANLFAKLGVDDRGAATLTWIGDPRAATQFDSRYAAKTRVRDIAEVPETRVIMPLERLP